ncbi:unnamed protein product [Rotaria sordida]|uniref:EF-hand domain-containing protein n=1 Tax=Rotaria sordida TaxID=392033 RepID=A0A819GLT3_9BILA|nr:unnamed protein product [Rotaria sordida]CAF1177230.1 unnamed protein product [Rotaria sordida]CAF3590067.1 unnamed protein product [Rotaria sordida]CAF3884780.1 unnamed protein product [Rotaria sordida]
MFTLLPSLCLIGVQYFRQWKAPHYQEKNIIEIFEINDNNTKEIQKDIQIVVDQPTIPSNLDESVDSTSEGISDQDHGIKLHKKRSHRRRRKTPLNGLSSDDITYLIKKTGFTRENILAWYEDFLRDCPDGKLSKKKFIDIYQQFYKKGHVTKFCEHAFRLFDKDGSGHMEFMEFLFAVSLTASKDPVRKIELFFSMYDIDHNGLIDQNEMRSVLESIYELMGVDISDPSRIDTKVHELFSKVECDSLGYLGKDQFAKACQIDRHIRKLLMPTTKSLNN